MKKRLLWALFDIALLMGLAFWLAPSRAATCDYPSTDITNASPVDSYPITYWPIVAGTVLVQYYTALTCLPYASYAWDALKGPYSLGVLRGTAVFVRITVISADGSVPARSAVYYLKYPADPVSITPGAPTNLLVR